MKFILQRLVGQRIVLNEVRSKTLRIGRGTNAQLRSDNPAVALEHAVIEFTEQGYELYDRGSVTGTYLNKKPIENSRLTKGDEIEIGDLKITVQVADAGRPAFLRVENVELEEEQEQEAAPAGPVAAGAAPRGVVLKAPKIDYARAYQLDRKLVTKNSVALLFLLAAIAGICGVAFGKKEIAFRPGALSVAHSSAVLPSGDRVIGENNCSVCHDPFRGASDNKCNACHQQAFHSVKKAVTGSCIGCHTEHRQLTNLKSVQQGECVKCHADLKNLNGSPVAVSPHITHFETDHPEFALTIFKDGKLQSVRVGDPLARRSDTNLFKFNHQCHLLGTCNKKLDPQTSTMVVEKLDCTSCHQIEGGSGLIDPRSYDKYCSRCHPLTFDNRYPPVPHHLTLPTVAGFIANAYSGNTALLNKSAEEVAKIFAQGNRVETNVGSATVVNAQQTVKARCLQCHEFKATGEAVRPPVTRRHWFEGAVYFNHTDHLNAAVKTKCVDCHSGVLESTETADVSMPSIKACTRCHEDSGEFGEKGIDKCSTCHFYHEQTISKGKGWTKRAALDLSLPESVALTGGGAGAASGASGARLIGASLLKVAIVGIVLLGALIGVGLLVSRSRKKPTKAPAATVPAPSAQPAAPPQTAAAPAQHRPKVKAAPAPPPAPPKEPEVMPQHTVAMEMPDMSAFPKPGEAGVSTGTVVDVEWWGTLMCTSGALAGKSFTIDAKGFYIGRDPDMSQVMIDDSRISRRHVWVGVKDSKVVAVEQGSTNGTFLNKAGSQRITEVVLNTGDVLILGDNVASFRYDK
ncbi:MAG TPA: FHA domain-containing protein [Thermoanaerobaculia bacterium]|nr:FHA domain-containing protein [Thermoanaerobaculia bacterium]